jgi:hypothetical protein
MLLFGLITYGSMQEHRLMQRYHTSYFWWGSIRLDTDPLSTRSGLNQCAQESEGNCYVDLGIRWGTHGWIEVAYLITAFPAYLPTAAVVRGLAFFGVSELLSFIVAMPLFTFGWFYTVGWLLDRWRYKRFLRRVQVNG